ncbi:hypothetical protein D3C76_1630380 [compost metagenome]
MFPQQLLMLASARNLAFLHEQNLIGIHDRGQPVGDNQRRPSLHQIGQSLLHDGLGLAVQA